MQVITFVVTFCALLTCASAANATTTTTMDSNATTMAPTTTTTTMAPTTTTTMMDANATMAPTTTTTMAPTTTTTMAPTTTTTMAPTTTTTVDGNSMATSTTTTTGSMGGATTTTMMAVYVEVDTTTMSNTATSTVTGAMKFTVANACDFVQNQNITNALIKGIASMAGITPAQVTLVLTAAGCRRLSQDRRLTDKEVTAAYTLVVTALDSTSIQGMLSNKTADAAQATLMEALSQAGFSGATYSITVTEKPSATVETAADGAPRAFASMLAACTTVAMAMGLSLRD